MMATKSDVLSSKDSLLNKTDSRIVSPSRKTLASLEAQLIIGVLDDCIQKMEIVCLLPSVLSCLETPSVGLSEEVVKALEDHHVLENRYQDMMLNSVNECDPTRQAQSIKTIQDSFRNILRLLRRFPKSQMLKAVESNTEENMGSRKLMEGLGELKKVVLERLLTTSSEEQDRSRKIQEVTQRHNVQQKQIELLEKEVAIAIKDKDEEVSMLTKQMEQLTILLHQMEQGLEESVVRTQQEAEKQSQSNKKNSEGNRQRMQQEANHVTAQLNIAIETNREKEQALRKKKYKEETEIENLIQKYDTEMGEKQTELEEMTRRYDEEMAELKELIEHCADLDLEYSQIIEERQKAQEQKEQQEKEIELQSRAAVVIQAYWRDFCMRKTLKAKEKPKKAKKGKGKKGNGKKSK